MLIPEASLSAYSEDSGTTVTEVMALATSSSFVYDSSLAGLQSKNSTRPYVLLADE
jgi:hypothetical protein